MGGIYMQVVFYGLMHNPLYIAATGNPFKPAKYKGVVGHNHITVPLPCLLQYGLGYIQGEQYAFYCRLGVAYLQATVIITFLIAEGRKIFERLHNIFNKHCCVFKIHLPR